ncbi:MAG TPA: fimbria/pilus outer membrane usher protein [Herbaspirillum sp.]|jgi:outer membrane usher protein
MIASCAAYAADETLALEVTLNGRPTQLIAEFTLRDGAIYAGKEELVSIGIALPPGDEAALIPLSRFTNDVQLDQGAQKISINVPVDYLVTTELATAVFSANDLPLADSGTGLVINYDLLASRADNQQMLSGLIDGRFYSNGGVFGSSGLFYSGNAAAGTQLPSVRLDTGFTHSDPRSLRRYRVGDFISSGLSWSRPVRLGGAQLSTDFNLRPDLVLYPSPAIRGEATVPSNVDLFVNGVRQFSQSVAPGPFEIRQAPIASGAGQIAVAVTDALGRQSYQNLSFYTSGKLLKPGLSSYSLEAGWVRRNYGLASNDYGEAALSSSLRYGYTPSLTLEAHGEGMRGLAQAGAGLVANINNWGILSASLAGSNADDDNGSGDTAGSGLQYSLGIERSAGNFSFSLARTQASSEYRDIGAIEGSPVLRSQTTASVGLALGAYGSFNVAYTAVDSAAFTGFADTGNTTGDDNGRSGNIRVLSLSYFTSLAQRATLFVSAFKQLNESNASLTVGLVIPLGARDVIGINNTSGGGNSQLSLQASRPTVSPGDFGWQLLDNEGSFVQRSAEFAYKGMHARPTFAVSQNGEQVGERIGLRGAVAVADHSVFLTNWIDDSFAVVNAGGMKKIGVFVENRYAGRTDSGGRLLVPDLRSYDVNRIAIDMLDLPIDADVDTSERMIKPRDRSGVVVRFDTRQSSSARVVLVDGSGHYVPAGARVTVLESDLKAPVGYDGETFLSQLGENNNLQVALPDGGSCRTQFKASARSNSILEIGPLVCQ